MGMARLIDVDEYRKCVEGFIINKIPKKELLWHINRMPTVVAVDVKQYEALREQYHELRENFIDYVCSGTCNAAPYCLNRCPECVDKRGWCNQGSDECHGFNPAEVII